MSLRSKSKSTTTSSLRRHRQQQTKEIGRSRCRHSSIVAWLASHRWLARASAADSSNALSATSALSIEARLRATSCDVTLSNRQLQQIRFLFQCDSSNIETRISRQANEQTQHNTEIIFHRLLTLVFVGNRIGNRRELGLDGTKAQIRTTCLIVFAKKSKDNEKHEKQSETEFCAQCSAKLHSVKCDKAQHSEHKLHIRQAQSAILVH